MKPKKKVGRLTRPVLPGVHKVTSRDKVYYYMRDGARLPDPNLDPVAFARAYQEARQAKPVAKAGQKGRQCISDLVAEYRASGDFARLAVSTRKLYANVLVAVESRFGTLAVVALNSDRMAAQIRRWRDEIADRPRSADTRVEVLSSMLQWAVRYGHITKNPAHGIEGIHRANRSDIIWTEEELARLISAATPECARAITVAAYTGLRLGDVVGLLWTEVDFDDGVIERATNKSGGRTKAMPPLLPEARRALEASPRIARTALTSGLKRPWTVSGLGNAFRDARNAIGVRKRFHDLRGTAATRFAAAGFSAQEIARFMGWEEGRVEAILRRYVSRRATAREAAKRNRSGSPE